jgi:hypothetical protein
LAVGGADLHEITRQLDLAHHFRPQVVLISGGGNDPLYYEAPLDAIRYDFAFLLRHLGKEHKSVVTLIPYISDRNFADRITYEAGRFVGSAFYSHAKVLARNKITALVSPQSVQPEN